MADCGATGSALDRSAAHIIASTIGGGGGGQNATRAGKSIAAFLGNVAHTGTSANSNGHSAMPLLAPSSLVVHGHPAASMMEQQAWNNSQYRPPPQDQMMHRGNMKMNVNHPMQQNYGHGPMSMSMPMSMPMSMRNNQIHPAQQMNMNMNPANANASMQMNMMHHQMAMMQMAQQQQHQQQQQQLSRQQQQESLRQQQQELLRQQQQRQQRLTQEVNAENTDHQEQPQEREEDWHQGLEDEFQSYLNTYKNEIQSQNDAASTNESQYVNAERGHEGYVEGASIEQLAAAWEEAEKEFSTDDYANLASASASGYDYQDDIAANSHAHYEFSEESEVYGQRDQISNANSNANAEDKYIDLMSEGMKHFQEGNIADAILCFESELRNVDGDNSDAWMMLGKCHAENDEDRRAIICLENAVERDPYLSEALLALGVSYVNELDHARALTHLNNWVTHNPSYAGLQMQVSSVGADLDAGKEGALVKLKNLLHQAKAYDEANGNLESSVDVLEILGVVCNVSREYDEAVECFRAAAGLRPDDHQLWNKLGATLANSNRSDEAQEAYQNALSIKPKYARSWLNMAIAHSNLQNYDEASRCYLQTLSLNPGAVHVWSYLRIALTCSEKWDLLPMAAAQDLQAFRQYFEFVQYK